MPNVWAVHSFIYDMSNNNINVPFFPLILNNIVHTHFTRTSSNIHVNLVSSILISIILYTVVLFTEMNLQLMFEHYLNLLS